MATTPIAFPWPQPVTQRETRTITPEWQLALQGLQNQSAAAGNVTAVGTLNNGQLLTGAGGHAIQTGDLSGDVTTSGSTVTTLSDTGVIAGTYGGASAIPVVTVNVQGRITGMTTAPIDAQRYMPVFVGGLAVTIGDALITVPWELT